VYSNDASGLLARQGGYKSARMGDISRNSAGVGWRVVVPVRTGTADPETGEAKEVKWNDFWLYGMKMMMMDGDIAAFIGQVDTSLYEHGSSAHVWNGGM
jgi:hypothetical protein